MAFDYARYDEARREFGEPATDAQVRHAVEYAGGQCGKVTGGRGCMRRVMEVLDESGAVVEHVSLSPPC